MSILCATHSVVREVAKSVQKLAAVAVAVGPGDGKATQQGIDAAKVCRSKKQLDYRMDTRTPAGSGKQGRGPQSCKIE